MNQREASKLNFTSNNTVEEINSGCLQRIADATEKMASNYTSLQNDRDLYKRWYEEERAYKNKLHNRIRSLKGVITKIKKTKNKLKRWK